MLRPTENDIAAALASVEIASAERVEATIGPAEVHAPAYPEYVTILREDWWAMGERATNAEARAARLARDLEEAREQAANDRRLMHAALRNAEKSAIPLMIATGLLAVALVGLMFAVAWRLW